MRNLKDSTASLRFPRLLKPRHYAMIGDLSNSSSTHPPRRNEAIAIKCVEECLLLLEKVIIINMIELTSTISMVNAFIQLTVISAIVFSTTIIVFFNASENFQLNAHQGVLVITGIIAFAIDFVVRINTRVIS